MSQPNGACPQTVIAARRPAPGQPMSGQPMPGQPRPAGPAGMGHWPAGYQPPVGFGRPNAPVGGFQPPPQVPAGQFGVPYGVRPGAPGVPPNAFGGRFCPVGVQPGAFGVPPNAFGGQPGAFGAPPPMVRRKRSAVGPVLLVCGFLVIGLIRFAIGEATGSALSTKPSTSAPSSSTSTPSSSAAPATQRPLSAADGERLVNRVSPGLVDIDVQLTGNRYESATGIVLDSSGLVMTNYHVVRNGLDMIVTNVTSKKKYHAVLVGTDPAHDVAVIQTKDATSLTPAVFGNSDTVALGDQVAGIGNAGGADDRPSVVTGPVTDLHASATATEEDGSNPEQLTDLISATDGLRAGDSGGALVNAGGLIIGMNVAGGVRGGAPDGSGDAIRINEAIKYAHQIVDHAASQ